jgi:hypothetical protein
MLITKVTGYRWTSEVQFVSKTGIFLFVTSRPALEPTQPHIQCIPGAMPRSKVFSEYKADHSSQSNTEV